MKLFRSSDNRTKLPFRLNIQHIPSSIGFLYIGNIQSGRWFILRVTHNNYKPFKSTLLSLSPGEKVEGLRIVLEDK